MTSSGSSGSASSWAHLWADDAVGDHALVPLASAAVDHVVPNDAAKRRAAQLEEARNVRARKLLREKESVIVPTQPVEFDVADIPAVVIDRLKTATQNDRADALVPYIRVALQAADASNNTIDDNPFLRSARDAIVLRETVVASKQATSQVLGVDSRTHDKDTILLAAAILAADRADRTRVEEHVVRAEEKGFRVIMYLDLVMQDETPMPVSSHDDSAGPLLDKLDRRHQRQQIADDPGEGVLARNLFTTPSSGGGTFRNAKAVRQAAKLLQSYAAWSMLVMTPQWRVLRYSRHDDRMAAKHGPHDRRDSAGEPPSKRCCICERGGVRGQKSGHL